MATFKAVANFAPRVVSFHQADATVPTAAYVFINPTDSGEYFKITDIAYIWDVASTGGTVEVNIVSSGTAAADGTNVLSAVTTASARVPRVNRPSTEATQLVSPGDSVAINPGGVQTNLVGLTVVVTLRPIHLRKTH